MGDSRKQISDQRFKTKRINGWLVINKGPRPLALNYGPTLWGLQWNGDWLHRATMFNTRKNAEKILNILDEPKKHRVVHVLEVFTAVPDVDGNGKIYYRLEIKRLARQHRKRIQKYKEWASKREEDAKQKLKEAQQFKKQAAILERFIYG